MSSIKLVTRTILATCILAMCGLATAHESRYYIDKRTADQENVLPFSGAVMVGTTLYLSGQLGLVNGQVPDTAEEEAKAVMDNIKAVLEKADMTMDDLVSVQIYSSDVSDYSAFNGVYRSYFTEAFPARAFIGSGELLFGARFEVVAVAARRN